MAVNERRTFFEMPLEAEGFDRAFSLAISALKRGSMQSIVAEENIQQFSHGRRWNHRANPHTVDGEMKTMSVEWETPFQDIVDGEPGHSTESRGRSLTPTNWAWCCS